MPKLSFIVPVFQPDPMILDQCVKSLADQSFKDFEVIFVLDGPSETARAVIAKYAQKATMSIIEIARGGAPKARNEGAKHAAGDYWVFWDCDSCIEPGASTVWIDILDKKPEVGFVYSSYKFFGGNLACESRPWDYFLLKVRNYISGHYPIRRELFPGWCEDLKSLQDWDFWLSVCEKAIEKGYDVDKIGYFLQGYAFSTAYPTPKSISGQGTGPDVWLERMDAVKRRHNIPENPVCVVSISNPHIGIQLAKLIGSEYQDNPTDKPHRYKTLIQVGFSLANDRVEHHAAVFQNKGTKNIIFWTADDINEIYNGITFRSIDTYRQLLNSACAAQYVEDKMAQDFMKKAGFETKILPIPMATKADVVPLPEKPKFVVDISAIYGQAIGAVDVSLPDVHLEVIGGATDITKYTGLIHFFGDKTLSASIKSAKLTGRHVISNVQDPFCGFVDDKESPEKLIVGVVKRVRECLSLGPDMNGREYYMKILEPEAFKKELVA